MAETLSWNLHGDDQLSGVLERLDRTLSKVASKFDSASRDAKNMGQSLQQVQAHVENTASKMEKLAQRAQAAGSHLSSAFSTAAGVIAGIGIGNLVSDIAHGMESLGTFALNSAAQMESSKVSFTAMMGSAQKANAFLAKLQNFAVITPFALSDLQQYASRLLAVGVNASDIIPMLTRIGDGAAAVGTGSFGIERAVTALNNMKLAGDVNIIHLRELGFAGVPVFDALAAKFKTTTAEIIKMVSAGKISVQDVFDAVEKGGGKAFSRINGMMDKQSATFEGKLSNFKDSAEQTFGKALEPALPFLGSLIEKVGNAIPKVISFIKGFGKEVKDVFAGSDVPDKIKRSLENFGRVTLPAIKRAFADVLKTIKDHKQGLEEFGRFIANVLIPGLTTLGLVAIRVGTNIINWSIAAMAGFVRFARTTTEIVTYFLSTILHEAVVAFGWIPGLGPKLQAAEKDFNHFAANVDANLASIEGRTISISFVGTFSKEGGTADIKKKHARGGGNQAGDLMLTGEEGPELWYAHAAGTTLTAAQTRAALGGTSGGGSDVIGVLRVEHTMSGEVIRTELLRLKRQRPGLPKIGL